LAQDRKLLLVNKPHKAPFEGVRVEQNAASTLLSLHSKCESQSSLGSLVELKSTYLLFLEVSARFTFCKNVDHVVLCVHCTCFHLGDWYVL